MFPKGRKASRQRNVAVCYESSVHRLFDKKEAKCEVVRCSKVALIAQENVCAFERARSSFLFSPTAEPFRAPYFTQKKIKKKSNRAIGMASPEGKGIFFFFFRIRQERVA